MNKSAFTIRTATKHDLQGKIGNFSAKLTTFVNELFDSNPKTKVFWVECPYQSVIWKDRKPGWGHDDLNKLKKPVGLVINNVLEVSEEFIFKNINRKRTTAIIPPAGFFGLFEAFGNLHGGWMITAGVKQFAVTPIPMGNKKILTKNGWSHAHENICRTLSHRASATYDYSDLLARVDNNGWHTDIIVFDAAQLSDSRCQNILYEIAIAQLSSLVRQNPGKSFVVEDSHAKEPSAINVQLPATIDAILDGDLPLFRLARDSDEDIFPFSCLSNELQKLAGNLIEDGGNIPVWIPAYLPASDTEKHYLYIGALANRFDLNELDSFVFQCVKQNHKYETHTKSMIEMIDVNYDEGLYQLHWESAAGNVATISRVRKKGNLSVELPDILKVKITEIFGKDIWTWPSTKCDCLYFSKEPSDG